jgi:hypothetical protein
MAAIHYQIKQILNTARINSFGLFSNCNYSHRFHTDSQNVEMKVIKAIWHYFDSTTGKKI